MELRASQAKQLETTLHRLKEYQAWLTKNWPLQLVSAPLISALAELKEWMLPLDDVKQLGGLHNQVNERVMEWLDAVLVETYAVLDDMCGMASTSCKPERWSNILSVAEVLEGFAKVEDCEGYGGEGWLGVSCAGLEALAST